MGLNSDFLYGIINNLKQSSRYSIRHKLYLLLIKIHRYAIKKFLFTSHRRIFCKYGLGSNPDFLIIGAQKAGTTPLYYYLLKHPEVKGAVTKETHYFTRAGEGFDLFTYQSYFPFNLSNDKRYITGEASPSYLFVPYVPQLMSQYLPDCKFIILLRNPIDRAFSHYQHSVTHQFESLSFTDALDNEETRLKNGINEIKEKGGKIEIISTSAYLNYSYKSRGIYVDQVRNWFVHFPREQFLILKYEELFQDPLASSKILFEFLDLPVIPIEEYPIRNVGRYDKKMELSTREYLKDYFKPHNKELQELLDIDVGYWE
jgi:hypothetical protein